MTVLILADEFDRTADAMVLELTTRDVAVCRVDTGWFPAQLQVSAQLRGGRWVGALRSPGRELDLAEVRSVWFRSPTAFGFPRQWSAVERQHAHNEARFGLGGVLASLPVLWVNHPNRTAEATYKPAQLAVAAAVGMMVPDTLVSNEPDAVRAFAEQHDDGVVTKMFAAASIVEEGQRKVAFTRRVPAGSLADLAGVEHTAHQFQQWVPKAHDARVVVVGRRHFAVAIYADSAAGHLDFRSDYAALRYEQVSEPDGLAAMVDAYLDHFGLSYAALDFVVDLDGRWWFLEANPGGQYGWLEQHTGAPITATLADLLTTGSRP